MVAYWLYIAMPIIVWMIFSLFSKKTVNSDDNLKRKYLIICGIFIFLMIGLRHYGVGSGDGVWYYNQWRVMSNASFSDLIKELRVLDVEDGYLTSVWIMTRFFKNPQFLFVFYGLLVAISVCRFIYKNCEDVVIATIMFNCLGLWGFMVQGIRQGIAMCICLYAIEHCKQKRFIPFIITIIIAMLFHASAIVLIIAYFFSFLKMNFKWYIATVAGLVVIMPLMDYIFDFINYVINDSYIIGDIEDVSGGFATTIIYILLVAISIVFVRENDLDERHYNLFFYMTLCGMITFLMRYNLNSITQRVAYYYMFGQLVLLPSLINKIFSNSYRTKALINMLAVLLCVGITIYKSSYSNLLPYYFFWQ